MSTILKALRRLEEDRNASVGRPLREAVASGGDAERKRRAGGWLLAAALALVVGLGAGAGTYWLVDLQAPPDPPAPAAVSARAVAPATTASPARAVAPATTPAPDRAANRIADRAETGPVAAPPPPAVVATELSEPPRELPAAALASPVEMMARPLPEPRIVESDPEQDARLFGGDRLAEPISELGRHKPGSRRAASTRREAGTPAEATTPERVADSGAVAGAPIAGDPWDVALAEDATRRRAAPVEPAAPPSDAAAPVEPAVPPSDAAAPVAARPLDAPVEAAEPPPAPAAERAASAAERAEGEVPGMRVEKTFWHPTAERRTAWIEVDGGVEELQEGDAIGPLVVSTIEPSGVVFQHQGTEIRRRVGE